MGNVLLGGDSSPAIVSVWLGIPSDCRFQGEFQIGDFGTPDIQVTLGDAADGTIMLFERTALERLVELAQHLLAVEHGSGSSPSRAIVESSLRDGIRAATRS